MKNWIMPVTDKDTAPRIGQAINHNYGYIAERLFIDVNDAANLLTDKFQWWSYAETSKYKRFEWRRKDYR